MDKIYLASGWFNTEQMRRVEVIEGVLKQFDVEVFSPRKHQNEHLEFGSKEWRKATFQNDIDHVEWADVVVAIYDEEDAGTMFELGYAYATNTPAIVFHEGSDIVNLMITDSLNAYVKTLGELSDALHYMVSESKIIEKPYTGEVI